MMPQRIPVVEQWPLTASALDGPICVKSQTDEWPINRLVRSQTLQIVYAEQTVNVETQDGTISSTVGDYFQLLAKGDGLDTYLKGWTVSNYLSDFAKLPLPAVFQSWFGDLPHGSRPDWNWIFVGPKGSNSALHIDVMCSSAWNLLVSGRKKWLFQSPALAADAGLLQDSLVVSSGNEARIQYTHIQEPGDVVIVPGGWAHAVENLDLTVSLTGNWVNSSNAQLVEADLALHESDPWRQVMASLRARYQIGFKI
ncbi:hypothetical protein CQ011_14955 [Arthrobacter sp. MYb213]|nr:hypothetical protein CQ011_14955 [Arthrobacter sp. MYb213]